MYLIQMERQADAPQPDGGQIGVPQPDGGTDRQVHLSQMEGQTDRCTSARWTDRQTGVP